MSTKILASELDHEQIRGLETIAVNDSRVAGLLHLVASLSSADGRKAMTREDWIAVEHAKAARPKNAQRVDPQ